MQGTLLNICFASLHRVGVVCRKTKNLLRKSSLNFCYALFLGCTAILAQQHPNIYMAYKTNESIIIDGKGNEPVWENTVWSSNFIDIEGVIKPKYKTKVKMTWDDDNLYFYAEMEEPHVWGTLKQRDTIIFYNNDFEIFIDPDGDTQNYMEFEINALNTVWDLYLTKPYRNKGNVLNNWDMKGIKTAIYIDGTLNNPFDIDKGWSVEIAIPWTAMEEAYSKNIPPTDTFWRINFSRVNWDYELNNNKYTRKKKADGAFAPEYNWVWSPQYVINMHEPERWGYVYFASEKAKDTSFEIPKDDYIKWYMYEVYRNLRQAKGNSDVLPKTKTIISKEEIEIKVQSHLLGNTIIVNSPFTGKTLTIDVDGKFEVYEK